MRYFLLYIFLEVIVSVNISSAVGGLFTFFEIVLSAMIGIGILTNFRKTLVENLTAVSYNCIDLKQFQSLNLFTLVGAILLVIPGFLTDIIGSIMQFSVITTMFVNRYNVKSNNCTSNSEYNNIQDDKDVIDVEIVQNSINKT